MDWNTPLLAIPFILIAIGAMVLAGKAWRHNRSPGSHFFKLLMLAVLIALISSVVGHIATLPGNKSPWSNAAFYSGVWLTIAFTITEGLFAWILFRMQIVAPVPRAHNFNLEQIGEGYLAIDNKGVILDANLLARRMLQIDNDKIIGRPAIIVLSRWPELVDLLNSTPKTRVEIKTSTEPPLHLEASLTLWRNQGMHTIGWILILYDITQRKEIEEKLRESEQLYRLLVDTSPDGVIMMGLDGRVTFTSPKVLDLFREDPDGGLVGRLSLDWVHSDDRSVADEHFARVFQGRESVSTFTCRLTRADHTTFWGEVTATAMYDELGSVRGVLITIRDVTERKKLELRLEINLEQQRFINDLLQILYRPHDLLSALGEALEQTGLFTQMNRVYLCQDSQDGQETFVELEWCSQDGKPRAREAPLFRYSKIPTWRRLMEVRGMILAPSNEILPRALPLANVSGESRLISIETNPTVPQDIADYMATWDIQSLAAFPVYGSEERLYGFIGFEDTSKVRHWSSEDLNLMWNVCKIISGVVVQKQFEEEERRQRMMTLALQDTARALNSTLNSEEVLDRILANLKSVAQHDAASIAMVDDDGNIRFVRWRGYTDAGSEWLQRRKIPLKSRETYNQMANTGEPTIIADTWLDKNWNAQEEFEGIRSYAGVPIQIKGKVVGFINLDSGQPDFFTRDTTNRLRVFADQAAIAIENSRLYHSARQRADEMSILYRIGLTLTAGLEMNTVLLGLFEQCQRVLPIDVFYVALFNEETKVIDHGLYYKEGEFQVVKPRSMDAEPSLSGAVILERRTMYLPDTLQPEIAGSYQIIRLGGRPARSFVGVPLIIMNQVVGVLSMQSNQPYAYSPEQIRLLETIATQAAIAVQNARLFDQMRQMAITDSVTGLFTRRHFSALGRGEVERAQRYKRLLSVLMVDIDHFKKVNDSYGHNAGDLVLKTAAEICRKALRLTDIVGRWGGEEFTIVLPEADQEGAMMIAERIRRMMEETKITISEGRTISVTVSIGVATLGSTCSHLELLVERADHALYVAKQTGRNRVSAYTDETVQV